MEDFCFVGHTAPKRQPKKRISRKDVMAKAKEVTEEEAARIRTLPQHFKNGRTNPEWLKARTIFPGIKRITGSMVANCGGHAYKQKGKPKEKKMEIALHQFLWDKFTGNQATQWGNDHEDICENVFKEEYAIDLMERNEKTQFEIRNPGLCVDWNEPWAGYSPDGIIEERFEDGSIAINLMEYKCPYSKRLITHEYKKPLYGPTRCPLSPHTSTCSHNITGYYYDQITYGMGMLLKMGLLKKGKNDNLFCYFCCWTPALFSYEKIQFDEKYFNWLFEQARNFWHDHYLPLAISKYNGDLQYGDTSLPVNL